MHANLVFGGRPRIYAAITSWSYSMIIEQQFLTNPDTLSCPGEYCTPEFYQLMGFCRV